MATITLNVQGPNVNPIADLNQMENQCKTLFSFNIKTTVNSEVKIYIERIEGGQNKQLAYDRAEYYNRGAWRPINNDEVTFITTTETIPVRVHIGNSIIEYETDVDEHGNEYLIDTLGNICNIIRVGVHDRTNGKSRLQKMSRCNGLKRCAVEPLPIPDPHVDSFVMTVDTTLDINENEFTIHAQDYFYDYNYTVIVQGEETAGITGAYTVHFDNPGIYDIEIYGEYPSIILDGTPDARKLIDVKQWGNQKWKSMSYAFMGCINLTGFSATDNPDTSEVEDFNALFDGATKFNSNINNWDVSSATSMRDTFKMAANFDQPLDNWDVSNVRDMQWMFLGASSFNQNINNWNVSNVLTMESMFREATNFNQPLDNWVPLNNEYFSRMFLRATNFNQPLDSWDVSSGLHFEAMFASAENFNQDLNSWDTSRMHTIGGMFSGATKFNGNISSWYTGNLLAMDDLFKNAEAFNTYIGDWDFSGVEVISNMFDGALSFDQDMSDWEFPSLYNGREFAPNLTEDYPYLDAIYQKWSKVGNIRDNVTIHFGNAMYLETTQPDKDILEVTHNWTITDGGMIPVEQYTTDFIITVDTNITGETDNTKFRIPVDSAYDYNYTVKVIEQDYEVEGITGSHTIEFAEPGVYDIIIRGQFPRPYFRVYLSGDGYKLIDIKQWGDTGLQSLRESFYQCSNLGEITATDAPNLNNVDDLYTMFRGSGFNSDINHWNTTNVINMSFTFYETPFNKPLDQWDVSSVQTMRGMFTKTPFNQPINTWNVSNVTDFNLMFCESAFNQPLDNWDVSSGVDFSFMFCETNFNQNINSWDISSATRLTGMFEDAIEYNKPLNDWDLQNVTHTYNMFSGAKKFNQPLNNWNVGSVTQMNGMFRYAEEFNQNINDWDVSNVPNFTEMFMDAKKFNQPLDNWDVSNADDFRRMFRDTNTFNQDLSNWNMTSAETLSEMFQGSNFNGDISDWVIPNIRLATNFASNFTEQYEHLDKIYQNWSQWIPEVLSSGTREIHFGNAKYYETNQPFKDVIYNRRWRPIDGGSIPLPIEIDEDTNIIIYFDDSGSMESTHQPLTQMRDTLLKDTILPYYNGNEQVYNEKVRVISVTDEAEDPDVAKMEERTLQMLDMGGKTPTSGKVIVLVFQDEAEPIYTAGKWAWDINTPRTQEYDDDLALLRNRLNNYPEDHYRGIIFQVLTDDYLTYNEFKTLLHAIEDGTGQYSGANGLSDREEIGYRYDVTPGATPEYYLDLIVGALNELGVHI